VLCALCPETDTKTGIRRKESYKKPVGRNKAIFYIAIIVEKN
jgi:hypothetical protein